MPGGRRGREAGAFHARPITFEWSLQGKCGPSRACGFAFQTRLDCPTRAGGPIPPPRPWLYSGWSTPLGLLPELLLNPEWAEPGCPQGCPSVCSSLAVALALKSWGLCVPSRLQILSGRDVQASPQGSSLSLWTQRRSPVHPGVPRPPLKCPSQYPPSWAGGLLEVLGMEAQSLGDWTLGAGRPGTTAQDRNFSWIFWLILSVTGQRWQMDRRRVGVLHSPG